MNLSKSKSASIHTDWVILRLAPSKNGSGIFWMEATFPIQYMNLVQANRRIREVIMPIVVKTLNKPITYGGQTWKPQ